MPELPEVFTMVEGLKTLTGRKIKSIWADKPNVFGIIKKTEGKKILCVERYGKNIVLGLSGGFSLLVHPKMTGRFLLNQRDKYGRVVFDFENGDFLTFSDKRRFANIVFGPKLEIEKKLDSLGDDALDISFEKFKNVLSSQKTKIKQALLDQSLVAGIGNIYADEILWKAKIHPMRLLDTLLDKETKNIFNAMNVILKKSIKLRGVSIQDYRDVFGKMGEYQNHRLVYGRTGECCKRCKTKIKRIKISQRSTHFCPNCQKI